MRVKIEFTVEVADEDRRTVAGINGMYGLASRKDIKIFFESRGTGGWTDIGDARRDPDEGAFR